MRGVLAVTSRTPGANLAWRIAVYEAMHLNAEYLEPEHLFIGILSLGKVIGDGIDQGSSSNVEILREWDALSSLLEIMGNDPVVLRRLMRSRLKVGMVVRNNIIIHRSQDCIECFNRAEAITSKVSANDLFSAIMDQPGNKITSVLLEGHWCSPANRVTDLILPDPSGSFGFNIKDALARDITRYTTNLSLWKEGSREYEVIIRAIKVKSVGLIQIYLDDNESDCLLDAMTNFFPFAGKSANKWVHAYEELEGSVKTKDQIPESVRTEIVRLSREIEDPNSND